MQFRSKLIGKFDPQFSAWGNAHGDPGAIAHLHRSPAGFQQFQIIRQKTFDAARLELSIAPV
jgi:hypothetical protein